MPSVDVRAIDLLLCRIPPEAIFNWLRADFPTGGPYDNDAFLRYSEACYSGYSKEEKDLIYQGITSGCRDFENRHGYPELPLALGTLLRFAEETLCEVQGEPMCRFAALDQWRDGFLLVGQDSIVCAYLAHLDLQRTSRRSDFGWAATIRVDHHGLNRVLGEGIADNHRHLKGSTQLAELSWCSLMNHPRDFTQKLAKLDDLLKPIQSRGVADNVWSAAERVELAAILRASLFRALRDRSCRGRVRKFVEADYVRKLSRAAAASGVADSLRLSYGKAVTEPDGGRVVLDYALTDGVYQACKESPYRVLAGERSFLYECFRATLGGEFDTSDMEHFCLYLALKIAIRGEQVQVNGEVGFYNFMLYQDRKSFPWSGTPYEWEAYRMAVNGPLDMQHVTSLESRMAPYDTPEEYIRDVSRVDLSTAFAGVAEDDLGDFLLSGYDPERDVGALWRPEHFYVMHFIKDDDESLRRTGKLCLACRHQQRRDVAKRQALALAEALRGSPYLCTRVRGIDACNKELNCRAEVFAHAFRFLSNLSPKGGEIGRLLPRCTPRLARTYHVGEDFYSIVDGVRAIDEAITFLDLCQGDRLGHALALGVDPATHCSRKSNVAVMTKQYHLDNLVWLLFRAPELGVDISPSTTEKVRQRAEILFREIYGDVVARIGWHVLLRDYYDSTLLRADDPECYRTLRFVKPGAFEGEYRDCALRGSDTRLSTLRQDERIAGLYGLYHYSEEVRERGQQTVRVKTEANEYLPMSQAQEALMSLVEDRGLIVECNPSSNVLIGTFGTYGKHPMFRFNHGSLCWPCFECHGRHRLKMCINTDDLGIFDTSIEFEYALVLRALANQCDENGARLFSEGDLDSYLCELRDMGKAAAFPPVAQSRTFPALVL